MRRILPPLNQLRAFEAAARHLSFKQAADELNVTPAAVSHQVKALEAFWGRKLFRRLNNALALTDAGECYHPLLTEGFGKLAEAGTRLAGRESRAVLTVAVLHSLASKWLGPRTSGFLAAHDDIDLHIEATDRHVDFRREEVDLVISYGLQGYSDCRQEELFRDRVFPVCSPAYLTESPPLDEPADLRGHPLLHIDWELRHGNSPDWQAWLEAAGTGDIDAGQGPRFNLSSMAIQAAIDGRGLALGQYLFAADDLAAGRLVKPFAMTLPLASPYCILSPSNRPLRPAAEAFMAWLLQEAQAYQRVWLDAGNEMPAAGKA